MESRRNGLYVVLAAVLIVVAIQVAYAAEEDKLPAVPSKYATKTMPQGGWTDPKAIEAGKKIYQEGVPAKGGKVLKCAKCHGDDGKPKLKGARDLRAAKRVNRFSEAYWLWVVSEGVPKTKMKGWKEFLTEEQIWQVMAYEHMFSHGGKSGVHDHAEIERAIASK